VGAPSAVVCAPRPLVDGRRERRGVGAALRGAPDRRRPGAQTAAARLAPVPSVAAGGGGLLAGGGMARALPGGLDIGAHTAAGNRYGGLNQDYTQTVRRGAVGGGGGRRSAVRE
jgi:hypothetical protein